LLPQRRFLASTGSVKAVTRKIPKEREARVFILVKGGGDAFKTGALSASYKITYRKI
jgi:hypothetical protein